MNIDDIGAIKKLDKSNVLGSTESLGQQLIDAWGAGQKIEIADEYSKTDKIIVAGMGGSALGAEIVSAVFGDELKQPLEIVRDYHLPGYADQNTLVVLSSYSGTTEETVSCGKEAKEKGSKIMVITSGGMLEKIALDEGYPLYKIEPKYNPCGQPRMAIGYNIGGMLALMTKIGLVGLDDRLVRKIADRVSGKKSEWGIEVTSEQNQVKRLAERLKGKIPVVVAGEHLKGNAKLFCNSINENAKNFSTFFWLPEANHHLMEGLMFPATGKELLRFIFLTSTNYGEPIKKRVRATMEVIGKNGYQMEEFRTTGGDHRLEEVFETIIWGNYLNFYLAMSNEIDPSPIPWVDYFKKRLKEEVSEKTE